MEETITRKKGWHHSKEWKQRMSERMSGKNNPAWKGDAVGYISLHEWIGNRKPKPNMCDSCHETAPRDLHNTPGTYKRNLEDWVWLCRSCHMIEDGRLEEMVKRNKDGLGKPLSEEHKRKVSDSIKSGYESGKIINPMKGKHHSIESKLKISKAFKGKHHTDEAKRKIRLANIGKHLSEETKQKIRELNSGIKNPNYGKHLSEETRKKMSESNKETWSSGRRI